MPTLLRSVAPALLAAWLCIPALAEDDEPISVPYEDMTAEEIAAQEAREAEYEKAVAAWTAYDEATCESQADHERRLASWRKAMEEWNKNPSLPSPGPRPEQVMPAPPPMPRPPAMGPFKGCP
jgi:hypothetical protein